MTSWILRNLKDLDPNAATNTLIGGKNGPLVNAFSHFTLCARNERKRYCSVVFSRIINGIIFSCVRSRFTGNRE